ncbi:MAG: hypothetical protein JNL01_04520 [Bdellovibrionales bacterium]|nr:hypothetical protein [Bdellovibrionales bacterium]
MTKQTRQWIAVIFALSQMACTKVVLFETKDPQSDGIRGKYWRQASYLELNANSPSTTALRSFHNFDIASAGTEAQLTATFYDAGLARFIGYGRLYADGLGWSNPGGDFASVAASSTAGVNLSYTAIAGGPGQFWLSVFQTNQAAGSQRLMTGLNNGMWQTAQQTAAGTFGKQYVTTTDETPGNPISVTFDAVGRAYIGVVDQAAGTVQLHRWTQNVGIDQTNVGQVATNNQVKLVFDGSRWVCAYSQDNTALDVLVQQCYDTTLTLAWNSSGATLPTPVSDLALSNRGFDAATNGNGTIVTVYNEFYLGVLNHVFARFTSDGVPVGSSGTAISTGMPSGYEVSNLNGASPQVVYLGDNRFGAAWIGIDTASQLSAVFYSEYYFGNWSTPEMIAPAMTYTTAPHYQSFHLFSNGDNNAGIAINYLTTGTTAGARQIQVARYHVNHGWLSSSTYGEGCPATGVGVAVCSMRPKGVILSSGTSVVVFGDLFGGLYRLGGAEFK